MSEKPEQRKPDPVDSDRDLNFYPVDTSAGETLSKAQLDGYNEIGSGDAAMQYAPGSHRHGALPHDQLDLDGTRVPGRQVSQPDLYHDQFLNVLKAGQASLHTDLLLHGSDANYSDRRRAGLMLRYTRADVRLLESYEYWKKSAVHCLKGDRSVFWYNRRRTEGEHPEKMADVWGEFDGQEMDAG